MNFTGNVLWWKINYNNMQLTYSAIVDMLKELQRAMVKLRWWRKLVFGSQRRFLGEIQPWTRSKQWYYIWKVKLSSKGHIPGRDYYVQNCVIRVEISMWWDVSSLMWIEHRLVMQRHVRSWHHVCRFSFRKANEISACETVVNGKSLDSWKVFTSRWLKCPPG